MSDKNLLDCRGLACPQPVISVKKRLEAGGGAFVVLVDNAPAKENVSKFAISQGCDVRIEADGALFRIAVTAPATAVVAGQPKRAGGDLRYLITQETLGQGSAELGAVLMKSFLYALREKRPLPATLLLINGGVKLACAGSAVLEHLQELSQLGVEILACGACLDYYELKEALAVGNITNMYTIVDLMNAGPLVTL